MGNKKKTISQFLDLNLFESVPNCNKYQSTNYGIASSINFCRMKDYIGITKWINMHYKLTDVVTPPTIARFLVCFPLFAYREWIFLPTQIGIPKNKKIIHWRKTRKYKLTSKTNLLSSIKLNPSTISENSLNQKW